MIGNKIYKKLNKNKVKFNYKVYKRKWHALSGQLTKP